LTYINDPFRKFARQFNEFISEAHMRIRPIVFAASAAMALAVFTAPGTAQPHGPGGPPGPGRHEMGSMLGPGMMHERMHRRICSPDAAGFAEWRINRFEQFIKPTEAQRAKFDAFKAASAKAAETMRAACPAETPRTMPARMEAMEKRMDAMLQAVKIIRPALDEFYATLDSEQKSRLDSGAGRGRFWRWRERW
jgi:hypothetical protein